MSESSKWEAAYQCPECLHVESLPWLVCGNCRTYARVLSPNAATRVHRFGLTRRLFAWAAGHGWHPAVVVEVAPLARKGN